MNRFFCVALMFFICSCPFAYADDRPAPDRELTVPTSEVPSSYEPNPVLEAIKDIRKDVRRATERLDEVEQVTVDLATRVEALEVRQQGTLTQLEDLEKRSDERLEQAAKLAAAVQLAEQETARAQEQIRIMQGNIQHLHGQVNTALARARAADAAARPKGIGKLIALLIPPLRHR